MTTFEQLKDLVETWMEADVPNENIIITEIGFDPLDYLEFVVNFESMFDIEFSDNDMERMIKENWSFKQLSEYIESLPKVNSKYRITPEQYFTMDYNQICEDLIKSEVNEINN